MKIFAPSYYNDFKCIAEKCKNNCCIGWEIDIDKDSLKFYKTQENIISRIDCTDTPHFILDKKDRCPFLNKKNLCDIIANYGEEKLCQICADHPRFRNFYDSRTEIGLGLTCEAAAKLILDSDFAVIQIGEDEEIPVNNTEEEIFFKNREKLLLDDFQKFIDLLLPDISLNTLAIEFKKLERLDKNWDKYLNTLRKRNENIKDVKINDLKKARNLFSYFVYRHLYDTSLQFCLLCTYFILAIKGNIYDVARMFSSEIEYSDENIDSLMYLINIKK